MLMEDYVFNRKYNVVHAGMFHIVALKPDGTVLAAGSNTYGECEVSGWTDIMDIQAGPNYTLGLRYDGTVVSAGLHSRAAETVSKWRNLIAVSAGVNLIAGLKADNTVVIYGGSYGNKWKNIIAVSAGNAHVVGLKEDGTLVWDGEGAYENNGQLLLQDAKNIREFYAGNRFTVYRCDDQLFAKAYTCEKGSGWTSMFNCIGDSFDSGWHEKWGSVAWFRLGMGNLLGICQDGTVVSEGYDNGEKISGIEQWKDIVDIDSGLSFVVAVDREGRMKLSGNEILQWVGHPLKEVLNWKLFDNPDVYDKFRENRLQMERSRIICRRNKVIEELTNIKPSIWNKNYRMLKEEYSVLEEELMRVSKLLQM